MEALGTSESPKRIAVATPVMPRGPPPRGLIFNQSRHEKGGKKVLHLSANFHIAVHNYLT